MFAPLKANSFLNFLTTIKQVTIFFLQISKNIKSKLYHTENSKTRGQTVDPDEVAHYQPPHQDLPCLQIELFSSPVLKELKGRSHFGMALLSREANRKSQKLSPFVQMMEKQKGVPI